MPFDDHVTVVIDAMRGIADALGLAGPAQAGSAAT
jgi:hypothetical protein